MSWIHRTSCGMRALAWICLLLAGCPWLTAAVPAPESVAILYNSAVPESRQLAEIYRAARSIPAANLIGLEMPGVPDISRVDYDKSILLPLRAEFDRRGWWKRSRDANGLTVPVRNRIRVLVTLRGVPLRILPTPPPPAPPVKPGAPAPPPASPITGHNEAAVDSELALFGVEGVPMDGTLQNKFYQSEKSISDADCPFLVLTARIDAPTYATCQRMILDAVAAEKTGLWGMAYVDIANKIAMGDQWLETIVQANVKAGIPTVVDRFNDTLPKNYPMNDAALYYGWYDWSVSGPFLNPRFRFRKGAIAIHIHSFSAEQLTKPDKNWSGPLLEKGAAVTIGNVFEPYLQLTANLGILHQRLLAGHSWVDACWMSMPVSSWQCVVLGDPLYQPFKHYDASGERLPQDDDFRALRLAALRWADDPIEHRKQLEGAAQRTRSATLSEACGLDLLDRKLPEEAAVRFRTAKGNSVRSEDKLRQDFHLIAIDRAANRKDLAVRALRDALTRYGDGTIPETDALKGWLDILDPPPPPPADPNKVRPPTAPAAPKPPPASVPKSPAAPKTKPVPAAKKS
jgi:uncharacterized protein (TIGR03790 family)